MPDRFLGKPEEVAVDQYGEVEPLVGEFRLFRVEVGFVDIWISLIATPSEKCT